MSKLTKAQAKQHAEACKILEKDVLTWDDKWFVLENWQEGANHVNSTAGAFFTPPELARDFAIDAGGGRVLDLCAGIGGLSFAVWSRMAWDRETDHDERQRQFTCVEINPAYVEIGKKIMPYARWICGSVFDLPADIGSFDTVFSNPPFGAVKHDGNAPRYTGKDFEYKVIDLASYLGDYGCFIVPQMSSPFKLSGVQNYADSRKDHFGNLPANEKYNRFQDVTKIDMEPGCGVDTAYYRDRWNGVAPICEIVLCDFVAARRAREPQPTLTDVLPLPADAPAQQLAMF
jgi:hypothetical protein